MTRQDMPLPDRNVCEMADAVIEALVFLSSLCHPVSGNTIKSGCDRHHPEAVILIT